MLHPIVPVGDSMVLVGDIMQGQSQPKNKSKLKSGAPKDILKVIPLTSFNQTNLHYDYIGKCSKRPKVTKDSIER